MIKKYLALFASAVLLCACQFGGDRVRTGDLLFVGYRAEVQDSTMAGAIAAATGNSSLNYVHVAIIEVANDTTWIVDATTGRGVARYPLEDFIRDFSEGADNQPVFELARLKGESRKALRSYVQRAKSHIGLPYDYHFLPDNGQYYCSELVYDSYVRADGSHIFHSAPMNFLDKDGNLPQYWSELFEQLGEEVPQGIPGTNPQDLHAEKNLLRYQDSNLDRQNQNL